MHGGGGGAAAFLCVKRKSMGKWENKHFGMSKQWLDYQTLHKKMKFSIMDFFIFCAVRRKNKMLSLILCNIWEI